MIGQVFTLLPYLSISSFFLLLIYSESNWGQSREQQEQEKAKEEENHAKLKEMEIKLRAGMEESALLKFHNNRLEKKVKALQEKMAQVSYTPTHISCHHTCGE